MDHGHLTVALVGNANVGKSVLFNQMTGLHQHVGNWPGKTVERAEGTLTFLGHTIDVIDLPGAYSLSCASAEEEVTRGYLETVSPYVVINVIDANALERNLFLTIQLLEMRPRIVVALNQMDMASERGKAVDHKRLSELLGVPVVPMVATRGVGLTELMTTVVQLAERDKTSATVIKYSNLIESAIARISAVLKDDISRISKRWVALHLLEDDAHYRRIVADRQPEVIDIVKELKLEIFHAYDQDASSVLIMERYALVRKIAESVTSHRESRSFLADRLDTLLLHPAVGYLAMAGILGLMFYGVFSLGGFLSALLDEAFGVIRTAYDSTFPGEFARLVWIGLIEGIVAGTTVAIPYILPFYIVLSVIEDSGYLARVAFLMDSSMHKIGFHGKGFIPLMLGFGCNVPACLSCGIMESRRERLMCVFASSLVPCSARTVVIMGLVATYVGFGWAMLLYLLDIALLLGLSRIAMGVWGGETSGLIMEMPCYRRPVAKATLQRVWARMREFIVMAFPIIVFGNLIIQSSAAFGLLEIVESWMSPVMVVWLGLPAVTGVVLIFGILRKELSLIMLATALGTTDFALVLTPVQMVVFAFVVMVYSPCVATIAAISKDFGVRRALLISVAELLIAFSLGGLLFRLLSLSGVLSG
ncbi:MAG: ferrous iron transport protein B [Candidatus Thorarchaeota archaeon]